MVTRNPRNKVVRWGIAGLTLAAVIGGGLWFMVSSRSASKALPSYRTEPVTRVTLERTVSCTGTLAAVGTVEVGTEVSGTIRELKVDYNDRVTSGQVLAVLDQTTYAASLESAEASLEKAKAELAQAEDEEARNKPLRDKGFLSVKEYMTYQTAAITARSSVRSAEANLKKARRDLDNTVVRAPIDGTVIQRNVEAGQTVAASLSSPTLFIIARDLSRMQIEADVDENDIGQVKEGQAARFTVPAHPKEVFDGNVSEIRLNPEVVSNVVTYTVVVEAANRDDLLLPGMTATIDFVVAKAENALSVPNAALTFSPAGTVKGDGSGVWMLAPDGRPARVAVTAGMTDATRTEVRDAAVLIEGTQVITGTLTAKETAASAKKNGNLFSSLLPKPPQGKKSLAGPPPGM